MANDLSSLRRKSKLGRHRAMRRIVQQTGTSCGVACVAMLARISYRDAFTVGLQLWGREY